jgi:MFS family permease
MPEQKVSGKAWAMVALLFGFMMINFADKVIVGLAGVPIMTDLQLSPKQFGLVGSSFFFLFSISAVVTGFIVDRIHSKWALVGMGLIWALVQFPMLGTIGVEALIACRIILGAGEGPAYPVALHATYKWFPDSRRALPGAIISQGASIGVIIVVPILTWIITNYNWHVAFGALGVVGLLWVLAFAIWGEEGKGDAAASAAHNSELRLPYRSLLINPTNLASWFSYFGAYFGLALVLSWFTPWLIKALGFSQATAGQLTALPFLVGFFVVIGGGWASEWMIRRGFTSRVARGVLTGAALIVGGLALLASPYVANVSLQILLVLLGVALPSIVYPLSPAILAEITPPSQRGAMLGINSAVGTSAGIIAPYLMGSVIEGAASAVDGYSLGFSICGWVTLAGGIIAVLFLRPDVQRAHLAVLSPAVAEAR